MRAAEESRDTGWGLGKTDVRHLWGQRGEGRETEIKESSRAPQPSTAEKPLATL